jgi:hypothetical protein
LLGQLNLVFANTQSKDDVQLQLTAQHWQQDLQYLAKERLVVSYSSRYYKFQDQDTPAVMPDKLIEPDWQTYKAGRDPAMEWILAQPLAK